MVQYPEDLKRIATANHCTIEMVNATYNGRPVWCLRNPKITGGKIGLPWFWSLTAKGVAYELNDDQVIEVVASLP